MWAIVGALAVAVALGIWIDARESMTTEIVMECLTCKKVYGRKPGHGVTGTSHGYCPDCIPEARKHYGLNRGEVNNG